MPNIGVPELVFLVVFVSVVVCFCRIFAKAGFPPYLGLLMLVPGANLVALYYLAYADWPIQARASQAGSAGRSEPAAAPEP